MTTLGTKMKMQIQSDINVVSWSGLPWPYLKCDDTGFTDPQPRYDSEGNVVSWSGNDIGDGAGNGGLTHDKGDGGSEGFRPGSNPLPAPQYNKGSGWLSLGGIDG